MSEIARDPYQRIVRFGVVQRRLELIVRDVAALAERFDSVICKVAATIDPSAPPDARAPIDGHAFWDQFERDVDRSINRAR